MKMRKILILLLLFVFSISIASVTIKDSIQENQKDIDSIEYLKSENSKLIIQKAEIIDILKWSISSILFIIIAVLGSSVYFNIRSSKKEIENIYKSIELKIESHKSEVEKGISEKVESLEKIYEVDIGEIGDNFALLTKEINSSIKTDNSKLVDSFQNQLDEFNTNYRQQITTIEKSLSSQIVSYEKTLEQVKENFSEKNNINSKSIESINISLLEQIDITEKKIKAYMMRVEAYMWDTRGVLDNSLMSYIDECEIHLELSNDGMINLSLSSIEDTVSKMKKIEEHNYKRFEKLCAKLPSKFSIIVAKIRNLLKQIEIEK